MYTLHMEIFMEDVLFSFTLETKQIATTTTLQTALCLTFRQNCISSVLKFELGAIKKRIISKPYFW